MNVRKWVVPVAVTGVALALRMAGIGFGLPQVLEEGIAAKRAWDMWGFGPGADFDLNPRFFNYPSLFIYLQLIVQGLVYLWLRAAGEIHSVLDLRVLYATDKTPFYLAGRTVTALFGAATAPLAFLVGRRAFGTAAGASAALLVAVNPALIEKSQVVEVDVPLTFFVLLACFLALRLETTPGARGHLAAGAAAGLATSTKYTGAFALLPLLAAHALARAAGERRRRRAADRGRVRMPRARFRDLGLAFAAFAGALLVTSPFLLLEADSVVHALGYERQHMRAGHFGLADTAAWGFYGLALGGDILGWPLAAAAVAGLALGLARRRPPALVLGAFVVPYLLAVGSWTMRAERYVLPIVPFATLFGAGFVLEVLARLPALGLRARRAAAALAVVLIASPSLAALPRDIVARRHDTRTEARRWIEAHVPPGSFIAMEAYGPELLAPLELWTLEEELRAHILRPGSGRVRLYAVQRIPMFQVQPEASAVFYNPGLYEIADFVLTSGAVRSRYEAEPRRFGRQLAFYRFLDERYERVREWTPRAGGGGVHLVLYRNPVHALPFARRDEVPRPDERSAPGEPLESTVAAFYYNLGLNCEAFGFADAAMGAYAIGLRNPGRGPNVHMNLALGMTRCLIARGDRARLASFLRMAAATAPEPRERAIWNRRLEQLAGGSRR